MLTLISTVSATTSLPEKASVISNGISKSSLNIIPLLVIMAIFYFLVLNPQQKRSKEHKQMLNTLKNGDKIITNGGIIGTITSIEETNAMCIATASDTIIQITKEAVLKKI
ncbi:preprotein translocase subunit YajC [Candidatus Xenohaliotis californiensis]|uniref:Sec translocon accessory complex subunit YajC n=1 Tax=Candidatus Xenohaliotis californiensis TaxID=84677 RepID=A0ABM9N8F5_9RICK|nr:preprotein translocase subunit YajC [Candidatus Xenohaliotis californiensis]